MAYGTEWLCIDMVHLAMFRQYQITKARASLTLVQQTLASKHKITGHIRDV
jgi:hypothetical protein